MTKRENGTTGKRETCCEIDAMMRIKSENTAISWIELFFEGDCSILRGGAQQFGPIAM